MSKFGIVLPAIRGTQGKRMYYTFSCPVKMLIKALSFSEHDIDPELNYQRETSVNRASKLAQYIMDNPESYVLPAITVSAQGSVKFKSIGKDDLQSLGSISLNFETKIIINDGQHRVMALKEALLNPECPENIQYEHLSVTMYVSSGLERDQQIFSDINRSVVKPTKSINILYDNRDIYGGIAKAIANKVPTFKGHVEKTQNVIGSGSNKMYTISAIYDACKYMLSYEDDLTEEQMAKEMVKTFKDVCQHMPDWIALKKKKAYASDLRAETIHAHAVGFMAIAKVIGELRITKDYMTKIGGLNKIDWSRDHKQWQGRCVVDGKMTKTSLAIALTANQIKRCLKIRLSPSDEATEKKLLA